MLDFLCELYYDARIHEHQILHSVQKLKKKKSCHFTHLPPKNNKRNSNHIKWLLHTCFHPTNSITPLSRIFLEKLIVPNYKKFSVILWKLVVHYRLYNYTPLFSEGEPDESNRRHPILFFKMHCIFTLEGTRWRSWLRHCATSRKVAGSIPDGVIGIFHVHNSSGRTMAPGLTQPLTEMSTRNISWGVNATST